MIAAALCMVWLLTGLGLITAGLVTGQHALIAVGLAPLAAMGAALVRGES